MFSMMSLSKSAGSIDTPAITVEVGLQPRASYRFGEQLDAPSQKRGQARFKRHETEEPNVGVGIEPYGKVDVAVQVFFTARNGAEYGEFSDTGSPQFGFMRPQDRNDVLR